MQDIYYFILTIDFVVNICIIYIVNIKQNLKQLIMLKNQPIIGYFLSSEKYSPSQTIRKSIVDAHGTTNYFASDVLRKHSNKEGLFVVKFSVCKKQTYSHKKGRSIFSLKAKSGAEVLEVIPASEWMPNPVKQKELAEV